VPSHTWVTLQFCPKNKMTACALNYTGELKLMHKVQQLTLRAISTDSHYVVAAYKYMRHYAVWLRDQLVEIDSALSVISASRDDKFKVLSRALFASFANAFTFVILYIHNVLSCCDISILESRHCQSSWRQGAIRPTSCQQATNLLPEIMISMSSISPQALPC